MSVEKVESVPATQEVPSKEAEKLDRIVEQAGKLEDCTAKLARLGKDCESFLIMHVGAETAKGAVRKLRAEAVSLIEDRCTQAGLYPRVNDWMKFHALVALIPEAAQLPQNASRAIIPGVRIDVRKGKPVFAASQESTTRKLVEDAIRGKMTGAACKEIIGIAKKQRLEKKLAALTSEQREAREASQEDAKVKRLAQTIADGLSELPLETFASILRESEDLQAYCADALELACGLPNGTLTELIAEMVAPVANNAAPETEAETSTEGALQAA